MNPSIAGMSGTFSRGSWPQASPYRSESSARAVMDSQPLAPPPPSQRVLPSYSWGPRRSTCWKAGHSRTTTTSPRTCAVGRTVSAFPVGWHCSLLPGRSSKSRQRPPLARLRGRIDLRRPSRDRVHPGRVLSEWLLLRRRLWPSLGGSVPARLMGAPVPSSARLDRGKCRHFAGSASTAALLRRRGRFRVSLVPGGAARSPGSQADRLLSAVLLHVGIDRALPSRVADSEYDSLAGSYSDRGRLPVSAGSG
jgi:hypothetical protein